MEDWTDEFIGKAQSELKAVVADWKYDYGASDEECATMMLWMAMTLTPELGQRIDLDSLKDR